MDLLLLGALFLVGLMADLIGRFTFLPRVSVLLLSGLLIGPGVFGLIPSQVADTWFPALTQMALAMVGFLLGQKLTVRTLKERGGGVVWLSITKAVGAAVVVLVACLALGVELPLALVLAFATSNGATVAGVADGLAEIGGSILLGAALGLPMALLTGRIVFGSRAGEPIMAESLGFVFIAAGLSSLLDLSPILTAVSMGAVVTSLASHHKQPFDAIEGIEWPFMILFFVLAGASLHLEYLAGAGLVVVIYLAARTVGTVLGVFIGGTTAGLDQRISRFLGFALLPQAGVALGLSLIAAQELPAYGQTILTVVLTSTVILELISPLINRAVLRGNEGATE